MSIVCPQCGLVYGTVDDLRRQLAAKTEQMEKLRDSLEDMVGQFAYFAKGGLHTGGLSALELAFDTLGWQDPHPCPERCCDEPGCESEATCGWPGPTGYRRTCHLHMKAAEAKEKPDG